jgi:hypothetical protein
MIESLDDLRLALTDKNGLESEEAAHEQVQRIGEAFKDWTDEELGSLFTYAGYFLRKRDPHAQGPFRRAVEALGELNRLETFMEGLEEIRRFIRRGHN